MSTVKRFMDRVSFEPNTGCWLWTGTMSGDGGYGRLVRLGEPNKYDYAHRLALTLFVGGDGTGLDACHKCNNTACVNPEHLYWGTPKDNMRDARRSGRMASGFKLPQTKFSTADISTIRRLASEGVRHRAIGRMFGTSKDYVWQLVNHGTASWRQRKKVRE